MMNIGIVGLGLIGGCLGLDLKAEGYQVYGVARREQTCIEAVNCHAVDTASPDLATLRPCEVVIICTPIATIVPLVAQLANVLAPDTVIADVGSVKSAITEKATQYWPYFVGAHPMSGKSEAGLGAAERGIFKDRPYVITPLPGTKPKAIATLEKIAQQLGSQLFYCTPEAHDRAVAWISHLPVMVSANLIYAVMQEPDAEVLTLAQQLASSGFRDTSRVGGGNPELGLMMAQYNRDEMLRSLKRYQAAISTTIDQLTAEDWQGIAEKLEMTAGARSHFVDPPNPLAPNPSPAPDTELP
ncbi:MAG: prephenate/arogenate dehydrogenase [Phormidesmis sp.]